MRKLLLLLAATFLFQTSKAQIQYNVYMDSVGLEHISNLKTPQVAISGYYNNLLNLPTMNSGITRPINSTSFTVSSVRLAFVFYNISISCTASIGSTSSGSVALQYFNTLSSTWITLATVANSNTVTLAIVLNSINVQTLVLCSPVPPGALCRMVSTSAGTTTISYINGIELY